MEMNNLRTESHIAQKLRRHKLRFQQNSDDPTRQHFDLLRPGYGSVPYDPYQDSIHSINSIPMLPPNHSFVDQDSCSQVSHDWNVVTASMNIDHSSYNQDSGEIQHSGELPAYGSCTQYNNINYQNSLQEIVTSATVGSSSSSQERKNLLEIDHRLHRIHSSEQLGFNGITITNTDTNTITQGLGLSPLSLTLSTSVPKSELPKSFKVETLSNPDPKRLMGVVGFGPFGHRSVGPLGPFTGYATILKNSKYLEPAQELLSESCDVTGQICEDTRKILEEEMSRVSGESGASSDQTGYGSSEHGVGRSGSGSEGGYRPEFHHKKAKLLYMQEEVCRRDKQYHQQMQMVLSSFETVAGLTSATPYFSLALKSVSRHFHVVKNAISEQLTQMKKTLEDLCSPSKTFDANNATDSLRSMDPNFQRHGKSSGGTGFFGHQQPVWRPQRGLPERAVSVLKAWLFDHFLHPYPSDADKHMLATQTGLTRNQVSNWFINARVRIWKPMVEEIHTLETKGLAGSTSNNPLADSQDASHVGTGLITNKQQPECSRTSATLAMINDQNEPSEQLLEHEKRSRPDYQIPQATTTMDLSFADMVPYTRTAFETGGGVGPVSLTLGLRQNAEHVQQLQQHEHQFRQHFGGQLIHDFVG